MVAFDTNYLVRHLVQDDSRQCRIVASTMAKELEEGRSIVLFDLVLCETLWALDSVYGAGRNDLLVALKSLQREPAFHFENPERIGRAIERFENAKADFSDYLILEMSREKGAELQTFDKILKKERDA